MALRKYDWNTFLMWIKGALFQATGNPISAEKISLKREPILLSQFCVIEHYCVSKYLFLRIVRLMTFAQIHRETKNRNAHFLWAQSISTNLSGIIWFNSHFPYLNNNPMFFSVKPNNSGFRWVKSCVLLLSTRFDWKLMNHRLSFKADDVRRVENLNLFWKFMTFYHLFVCDLQCVQTQMFLLS